MRALSLWDPWASLVAIEAKRYETRSWATSYRGPIAIHSTKKFDEEDRSICLCEPFRSALVAGGIDTPEQLPRMAIIAVGRLVGIARAEDERASLSEQERAFGDYSDGRFAWAFADVRRLPEPIPCSGLQGLWTVPLVVVARVEEQLRGATTR